MSKSFTEIALEEMNKEDRALVAVAKKMILSKPYGKHLKLVENEIRNSIRDSVKGASDDISRTNDRQ